MAALIPPSWREDDRDAASGEVRTKGPGHVLIIDDDPDVRQLFHDILHGAGFEAVAAESGAEGLLVLKNDPQVRVILLDLLMPEMDGWRFRHHQLSHPRFAVIPTVIVTGAPLGGAAHEQLKAADYLSKPVSRERLIDVVARYCDRVNSGDVPVQ
jgi:CheY-like chemotaxis protein